MKAMASRGCSVPQLGSSLSAPCRRGGPFRSWDVAFGQTASTGFSSRLSCSSEHQQRLAVPNLGAKGVKKPEFASGENFAIVRQSDPEGAAEHLKHFEVAESGDVSRPSEAEDDNSEVLIECRDVYKSFGEKHILRGASFKIREGEAVGIIGPSGTGKSTVLRIMAGLLAPDQGEVYVCGQKRHGLISDEALSGLRIGLVFQSAALFDSLTVRENVGFMLYEHSDLPKEKIAELVADSLASVGLKGVEERLPSELSGGMKKRVALARAIISDDRADHSERELVMYDEPTAGLDPIASTVVEDLIRSVHIKGKDARGKPGKISCYVVVTHQHSTIRRAVDRVLFLHEGKVVWQGPTAEFETTSNPIVRQFADGSLKGPIRY